MKSIWHLRFYIVILSLLNIVRPIKSSRMRWMGRVARVAELRNVYKFLVGKPEGKETL
jgi:hypothetical protein